MSSPSAGIAGRAAPPSRASVLLELGAVLVLTALFLAVFSSRPRWVDLLLALFALALIAALTRRSQALWAQIPAAGLERSAARRRAWRAIGVFTALGIAALGIAGAVLGYAADGWPGAARRIVNWHFFVACALYFPWALLQQFIFQFYFLGRLLWVVPVWVTMPLAGAAFSLAHFPRLPVMVGTAAAGVLWAWTYAKYRTLLPLAASHAVLGSALHYWIFERDLARLWDAAWRDLLRLSSAL